jgi:hypothetical protein
MGKLDGEDGGKMDGVGLPCELDDWEWSTAIVEDLSFFWGIHFKLLFSGWKRFRRTIILIGCDQ